MSEKDRRKIQIGKFVEFACLYPKQVSCKNTRKYTLNLDKGQFEQVEEVDHLSLHQWYDAFVIFMSIRLEFAPHEAQGLLRHWQIVRGLQAQRRDGIHYDCQFRRLKEQHPDIAWGEYLAELVGEVPMLPFTRGYSQGRRFGSGFQGQPFGAGYKPRPAYQPRPQYRPVGIRTCHHYNAPNGCHILRCRFPHNCGRCKKPGHPAFQCKQSVAAQS